VHEKVLSDGLKIKPLIGFVNHYPYNNISDFIKKLDTYLKSTCSANSKLTFDTKAKTLACG
jgi:hypothetical protein